LAVLVAVWSPFIEDVHPTSLTVIVVSAGLAALVGFGSFVVDLVKRDSATADRALLEMYIAAEDTESDLDQVVDRFKGRHEEFGRAVERLLDDDLVEAEVRRSGSGTLVSARVYRVTAKGRREATGIRG
jgi:hypothetical protein